MEIVALIITLVVMAAGLAGAILPLPSIPLIYAGYFIYGFASGWEDYGLRLMIALGVVTVLTQVIDFLVGAVGSKQYGGSGMGAVGSIIGALVGLVFFNLIGLIIGTFAGALVGELIKGRSMNEAIRSGWGAFLGFVAGSIFKLILGLMMIVTFLVLVIT